METAVLFCGYGKNLTANMRDYIRSSYFEIAKDFAKKGGVCRIILSGGNTSEDSSFATEAEMMKSVIDGILEKDGRFKDIISIETEDYAYNTRTNILFFKRLLGEKVEAYDNIVVVCNEAHFAKNMAACLKIFGRRIVSQKVIFYTFPLTERFSENIKTYLKTVFEVSGYFLRSLGRYLEYWQWWIRTGRNERLNYWKFRLKYRGELI